MLSLNNKTNFHQLSVFFLCQSHQLRTAIFATITLLRIGVQSSISFSIFDQLTERSNSPAMVSPYRSKVKDDFLIVGVTKYRWRHNVDLIEELLQDWDFF